MHRFIRTDWWNVLKPQFQQPYYQNLRKFLVFEYTHELIHPDARLIFEAFQLTSFSNTKVVILGQDPYPEPHTAMGLSFSVLPTAKIPSSLQNIYKELYHDLHIPPAHHGCLVSWAQQGVLLLNSVLTVNDGQPGSNYGHGWEHLTDYAIEQLSKRPTPVVFILWGRKAQQKEKYIDSSRNVVIASSHPSFYSADRGFFGSKPFSKANYALKQFHEVPINWQLPSHISMSQLKQIL